MTNLGEPSIETPWPRTLFEVGYEHLIDSRRRDTTDSARDRAEMAYAAGLYFAAAQTSALLVVAESLGELVEQQKLANTVGAFTAGGIDGDDLEMNAGEIHAVMYLIRAGIRDIVANSDSESEPA